MRLAELAALLQGDLVGDGAGEVEVSGLSSPHDAEPGDLVVCFDEAAVRAAEAGAAAAAVAPRDVASSLPLIAVDQPRRALVMMLHALEPAVPPPGGVHPTAVVDPDARLGDDVTVGPYTVIEAGVAVGNRTRIGAHCVVGEGCRIGDDGLLHPRVTLYRRTELGHRVILHSGVVLGADGFGYRPEDGRHLKIPQLGRVVIDDDVEIGANTTIDRATVGVTRIGAGTKIDNLVMIAHNCRVGQSSLIISQVGVAGSTTLGNGVVLAGQVGLADHLTIGDGAVLGAKSGVMHNVPPGERWLGIPAQPEREFGAQLASVRRLRELFRRLKAVERELGLRDGANAEKK